MRVDNKYFVRNFNSQQYPKKQTLLFETRANMLDNHTRYASRLLDFHILKSEAESTVQYF